MLQMYFFCWNNIDLKYTSSSVIHQVEVYFKYIWSTFEVCFKYTLEVYFQYIWSILHFSKGLCPRTEKTLLLRKAKGAQVTVNREGQRDITTFCSFNLWVFNIFVLLPATIMHCVASCNNNAVFVGFSSICLESLGFL